MSDAGDQTEDVGGMKAQEVDFLMECLRNTVGGGLQVDVKTVAENKGYKNAKSVSNKLALLKKKYNIPLSGSGAGRATTNAEDGHTSPVKGSGVKKTASARKPAAKKTQPKQAAKSESDDEEEVKKLLGESDSDEVKKPSSEADSDDDKA